MAATPDHFALPPVSILYVPGHKARALEKVATLAADMLIIDLEDAVPAEAKALAREQTARAVRAGFAGKLVAVRTAAVGAADHAADMAMIADCARAGHAPDAVVLPKVTSAGDVDAASLPAAVPVLAMIETPGAVLDARMIAAHPRVIGLIAGFNDLAHAMRLPGRDDRAALGVAAQLLLLHARAAGALAYDGVYNRIDDVAGFAAEAAEAAMLGFDGKTLIHPAQVDPCNAAFAPLPGQIAEAEALIAASSGGAERFAGRMIEDMHVDAARQMLATLALRTARRTCNTAV